MLQHSVILVVILLIFTITCIPICEISTPQDKLILLQSENMEIAYSSYIKGFNLTYQKLEDSPHISSVSLHDPLKTIHTSKLYCRGVFSSEPRVLISNVQTSRGGRWEGEMFVLLADDNDFCLSLGKVYTDRVQFFNYQALVRIQINSCYSTNKISSGDWVIHCEDSKGQILYYYKSGKLKSKRFELKEPVIKSVIYNDLVDEKEVWRLIVLTQTFIRIYKIENVITELMTLDAEFFELESIDLTDFFILDKLVISDRTQGFGRMSLVNDTISTIETISSNGSTILKIAGIGTTYFLLSEHQIFEIVWMESSSAVNVYMIEGDIANVKSLLANHQIIVIESQGYDYIHKRQETSSNYLLEKKKNSILNTRILNPQCNLMLEINTKQVVMKQIGEGYISIANLTDNIKFQLIATSIDDTELQCKVEILLELCEDLNKIYITDTLDTEFKISANTTLVIPIGQYFTGLNLQYHAINTPEITYQFKIKDTLKLFSAYANYEVLELLEIDGLTFYKISRYANTYYTEICSQSNLVCQPICHRTIDGEVVKFKIFRVSSNSYFNNLITYTLKNQTNTIYIQKLNINKTIFTFKTFTIDKKEYSEIYDYTLSNQYVFIIHKQLNTINVYQLDFKKYPHVQTINNRILSHEQIFKPRQIRILPLVSRNVYIKTIDSIIILDFSPKKVRVLSVIEIDMTKIEHWDEWDFKYNQNVIDIISIFTNSISEYSIIEPEKPMFLKYLPLLDLKIVKPIISYLSPTNKLFINTLSEDGYQLTIFRVGAPSIDSLYFSFQIDLQDQGKDSVSNIKGLKLQQDNLILIYQNSSYHVWTQRIRPSVSLMLSTNVPNNQFITTIPMTTSIKSPSDLLAVNNLLKIINYEQKISTLSSNQPIVLPATAHNVIISFDQSYWFKGSIVRMDLISDGSWSDKVELIHQFNKQEKDENIKVALDILEENGIIWILTVNRTIIALNSNLVPVRKMIIGISNNCKRFTKSPKMILVFCQTLEKQKYITPIYLPGNDVYNNFSDIFFKNWIPSNIFKAKIVADWLIILDNDLFGGGQGKVYIFKINLTVREISLTEVRMLTPGSFGFLQSNALINDYEIVLIRKDSYQIYFSINIFGLVTTQLKTIADIESQWVSIDLLNDSPAYMQKYQIDGNQVLQIRVIDAYESSFESQEKYHHIVVITTKAGAHLQLQFNYQINSSSQNSLTFISSDFIQAFNTYFNQTRLNWLIAPRYDGSRQNLFLTGYFNDTVYNSTIVIYKLSTARPQQSVKQFPIFKQGIMFDCSTPADIAYALFIVDKTIRFSWIPICNDQFQIKNYSLVIYHLSNNISLKMNYNTPPTKLTELRFHALNDYSDATFNLAVRIIPKDQMKWWQILLICSSVILMFVIIFCVIRQLRISKEVENKKDFAERLASLITDSLEEGEAKERKKETKFVVISGEEGDVSDEDDDEYQKGQKRAREKKRQAEREKQRERQRGREKEIQSNKFKEKEKQKYDNNRILTHLESDDFIDVSMEDVQCNEQEFEDILEKTEEID